MSDQIANTNLERRAEPKQRRAQERIDGIIEATQDLLDRLAPSEITTSAVAKEADIPVGSVYRYFPNIHAIYSTIFDRFHEASLQAARELQPAAQGDWRAQIRTTIEAIAKALESRACYRAVVLQTFSTPELSAVREKWNQQYAEGLAAAWEANGARFDDVDPRIVSRLAVEIFGASQMQILRNWDDTKKRDMIARERMIALQNYLAAYLD